jgi:hydroxymethylpyrimidine pyrophosphatase-like HAD family hydrolase
MADIAIDFDGTVVEHKYPNVGDNAQYCIPVLKKLLKSGHRLVLNTMRSGKGLEDAVNWFRANEIELYGINHNPSQTWTTSPKVYAHLYIDDAALGAPLMMQNGSPVINWQVVKRYLEENGYI